MILWYFNQLKTINPQINHQINARISVEIPKDHLAENLNYIRDYLLAKTKENCHNQLETVEQWIDTHVVVKTLKDNSKESFPVQESHRFSQILFGPSYGFMVLLGDAGIGKSLALYYFANQLIEQAKEDVKKPIPLIFHLADWAMQPLLSFEEWLKFELIQLEVGKKNIDTDFDSLLTHKRCIFLLDGFDNLPPQQRLRHLKEINDFIKEYGKPHLGGVIIVSRSDEYHLAKEQLKEQLLEKKDSFSFDAEATIQALTVEKIHAYIAATDHTLPPRLPLDTPPKSKTEQQLLELLKLPLSLVLLVKYANSHQIDDNTEIDRNSLISSYIDNRFEHKKHYHEKKRPKQPYEELAVKTWLGRIAKSMNMGSTFSVEGLTPKKILTDKQQYYYQGLFTVLFGLIFGAMMGGVAGLIFGKKRVSSFVHDDKPIMLPDAFMGIHQTLLQLINNDVLINKIQLVIYYASIGMICAILMSSLTFLVFKHFNFPEHLDFPIFMGGYLGLSLGVTGWLVDGSQWAFFATIFYGILGLFSGFLVNSKHLDTLVIELHQDTRWDYKLFFERWRNTFWGGLFIFVIVSLLLGLFLPKLSFAMILLQGFTISISLTLAYTFYHPRAQQDWSKKYFLPRQKIKAALKRSISMILIIGGLITLLITILAAYHLGWLGSLSFALRVGMPLGIVIGFMSYGGIEVLKHVTLRFVMYRYGIAPWDYPRFLEYAKQLTFLKPQSGGYAFRHDWFQEYFEKIQNRNSPQSTNLAESSQNRFNDEEKDNYKDCL